MKIDMKNLKHSLWFGALALLAASCMEVDNFDEPDAHFTGRIIDSTTGENILTDQGAGQVKIWEKSFSLNPGSQGIPVKQDGTFNNTKLFKGTYDVVPEGAWWPADTIRIGIGKKAVQDFEVTPYLRLFDLKTAMVDDSLAISCRLDVPPITEGLPRILDVKPFLSLTQFCGEGNHITYYDKMGSDDEKSYAKNYIVNVRKTWANLEKLEDGKSMVFSFKVDVKPGYIYFVRVGARVDDNFKKYNYTEIVKIEVPSK